MKRFLRSITWLALIVTLFVPSFTYAQSAGTNPVGNFLFWFGVAGLAICVFGLAFGFINWKNGTDGNDQIRIDRGRSFVIIFGVLTGFFLIVFFVGLYLRSPQQDTDLIDQTDLPQTADEARESIDQLLLLDSGPTGDSDIRNVLVRLLFNQPVRLSDLNQFVTITNEATGVPVLGEWSISNNFSTFLPNNACSAPNTDLRCFDPSSQYKVLISKELESLDGDAFRCTIPSDECAFFFGTGVEVDTSPPNIRLTFPFEQEGVSVESLQLVEALSRDDRAIAYIEFFADGDSIGVATVPEGLAQDEFRGAVNWDTTGLEPGPNHELQAVAVDNAGLQSITDSIDVEALAAHCFDEKQNEDETNIDCGGANCRLCENAVCEQNSQCASNLCFDGTCRVFPVIEELIFSQGAVGDYITIRGKNFGEALGRVAFLSEDGEEIDAEFPACESIWSNKQVIVEVPPGTGTGPVFIANADGFFDRTDDQKGIQQDFVLTEGASRIGLCPPDPGRQFIGETVTLSGKGFGDEIDRVSFGQILSEELSGWSDTFVESVKVPFVEPGVVPVTVQVGSERSNPVFLAVEKSPTLPQITTISPDSGPVGQIFSLVGDNFTDDMQVTFINVTTGEEDIARIDLPKVCEGLGTTKQRAFRVPRLDTGSYQVVTETPSGKSNRVTFRIIRSEPLPGICGMVPDNGPAGIEVNYFGEGFGETPAAVRFSPRIDNTQILSWSSEKVTAIAPLSARSGPTQIINDNNFLSNQMDFTVGQCSPDTCEAGMECCSNGACQKAGSCTNSVALSSYEWVFSTGADLNGPPRVIEEEGCESNTQSPSPFKDTTNACRNASVSARFSLNMNDATLNLQNITLRKCNTGAQIDIASCTTVIELGSLQIINSNQSGEGFIATPRSQLDGGTWYQGEISADVQAENGFNLPSPYIWSFQTGQDECQVDKVEVTPARATLRQLGTKQQYTGVATALNCNILNAEDFSWRWLSQDTAKASVERTTRPITRATANQVTSPGPPVEIFGAIPEFSLQDSGLLEIDFSAPKVIDQFPNCSSACVNAVLGARFDQSMQEESLKNTNAIQLFQCADKNCAREQLENAGVKNIRYNAVDNDIFFIPAAGLLKSSETYRVVLRNSIRSQSGIALEGLNYDSDGDTVIDSYSWIFTVKDDGELCSIAGVEVRPPEVEVGLIGEEIDYFSFPLSAPDECRAEGQLLNPDTFSWAWLSQSETVAEITNEDIEPKDTRIDALQIATSIGEGSTDIEAKAQGTTGSGTFEVICGFESDDQCPLPASLESHGVGGDRCCHPRPVIATVNPVDGSDQVCTTLAIEVQFNQKMDVNSLLTNIELEFDNGALPCGETQAPESAEEENEETTAWNQFRSVIDTVVAWLIPSTQAQSENFCRVDTQINTIENSDGTVARIFVREALKEGTRHRIRIIGDEDLSDQERAGVVSTQNVAMDGTQSSEFTTGDRECKLDLVDITITPPGEIGTKDAFFCAGRDDCEDDANSGQPGNQHQYIASGRDITGVLVEAEYDWVTNTDQLITIDPKEGDTIEATSKTDNGFEILTVFGRAVAPSTGSVTKSIDVRVFICENPWPSITEFPYTDSNFNFDSFYCRDAGEPGFDDDLPPLSEPVVDQNLGQILQESLFIVQPQQ